MSPYRQATQDSEKPKMRGFGMLPKIKTPPEFWWVVGAAVNLALAGLIGSYLSRELPGDQVNGKSLAVALAFGIMAVWCIMRGVVSLTNKD